ncbi:cobalamin-binding protein [Pseudothauera rhizosphaerae]|uniref:Cobalamin-binding protein n=1 Tax=Pseudothauera rhizosphaerae TaxID=2565932 RepID=A0A4S4AB99_9RHOO|nr:cobalamin-binding protein [Pseudothauera rhizosphaerae]THF56205.1 cobalamin-binding protein [Pseudothauera rhizosphaerae]
MITRITALAALLLCAPLAAAEIRLTDATGHELVLPGPAQRIVSLAPHITEVLFAAGAGDKVVGVVAYSDYPEAARRLPQVGSYTKVDLEAVAALRPDLVVGWVSGNPPANLDKLRALGIPVFVSEARNLADVATSLETVGRLAGTEAVAHAAAESFRARRAALAARYGARPTVRMFYQIWDRPLMTINGTHVISDAIRLCGGENVFAGLGPLAATIGVEAVLAADPEAIVASGMGEERPEWLEQWRNWPNLTAAATGNLFFIPPQLIQRHTPRLLDGAEQLCVHLEQARARREAAPR